MPELPDVEGFKLVAAHRHGKHLMARMDRGGWLTLHFGMTGALQFVRSSAEEPPFTRVRVDFASSISPRSRPRSAALSAM